MNLWCGGGSKKNKIVSAGRGNDGNAGVMDEPYEHYTIEPNRAKQLITININNSQDKYAKNNV